MVKQESPTGNRKRRTTHGITCPSAIQSRMGYPQLSVGAGPSALFLLTTFRRNWESTVFTGVCTGEGYPIKSNGGYPYPGWMGVPPSQDGWGYPPPPLGDRAAQRVLATRRAVCLLRSRRRTVLWTHIFNFMWIFQ